MITHFGAFWGAAGVLFLACDEASFTGVALPIDGGLLAVQSAGPALSYTS